MSAPATAPRALVAGGGIGGLAAAIGCARAGLQVQVIERASWFGEAGAGIQIGPNVTRVLQRWGLADALARVAARPERLQVNNAHSGSELGSLDLGERAQQRYGAPYLTVHRADLQELLVDTLGQHSGAQIQLHTSVEGFAQTEGAVAVRTNKEAELAAELLVGADGLWSRIREQLLADGPPQRTGHLAYRALLEQADLPRSLRSRYISVWLGRRLHVVAYPVRRGEAMNLVAIVHAQRDLPDLTLTDWDHSTNADDLRAALTGCCPALQDLVRAVPLWRLWVLCDRPPMRSALEQARGRVALLGDAAHPMRPYLAQGAAMAIEDAAELERVLQAGRDEIPAALQRYAANRWQRNARVQARARRNGRIFHASGVLGWGRDTSIRLLGSRVLDVPWLYRGP